jgi:Metallo-peptidase family M12B Reprolysin-like
MGAGHDFFCRQGATSVFAALMLTSLAGVASALDDLVAVDRPALAALPTGLEPAPEPSVVDLAVFYDGELLDRGYSLAKLDAVAALLLDFNNRALQTSGVPLTLHITYTAAFDRDLEGLDVSAAFGQLGLRAIELRDGLLNDFGVDAVMLIKATNDADYYLGMALLGTEANLSDPASVPFGVICLGAAPTSGVECFEHGALFAHEVGHLFGAGHQRDAEAGAIGAFEFSKASGCGGGTLVYSPSPGINEFYSTPNIVLNGVPCGVAASAGADGEDNAHTIDVTRSLMAALRPTMPVYGEVWIEDVTGDTLQEGGAAVSIGIRRSGNLTHRARVSVDLISRLFGAPDLAFNPPEVVFEPGQDVVSVSISAVDDTQDEPDETFTVGLRNAWQLTNISATVELTVIDNNEAPPPPPSPPPAAGGGAVDPAMLVVLLLFAALRHVGPCRLTQRHIFSSRCLCGTLRYTASAALLDRFLPPLRWHRTVSGQRTAVYGMAPHPQIEDQCVTVVEHHRVGRQSQRIPPTARGYNAVLDQRPAHGGPPGYGGEADHRKPAVQERLPGHPSNFSHNGIETRVRDTAYCALV